MRHAVRSITLACLLSLSSGSVTLAQHHGDHAMLVPSELNWRPVPSLPPDAEISVMEGPLDKTGPITARIRFPANYRLPAHTHPVIEHVTVISGTFPRSVRI